MRVPFTGVPFYGGVYLSKIAEMYVTLISVIMSGVFNILLSKTKLYKNSHKPIDNGKVLKDGKRLFGDNKTWKGFWGMTIGGGICQVIWGLICSLSPALTEKNLLYRTHENTIPLNFVCGLIFGLAYVVSELPNSFIKRRLDIQPGKTAKGLKGAVFFVIDQIDSLIGITFCLALICGFGIGQFLMFILIGGLTHISINLLMYALKVRKNL